MFFLKETDHASFEFLITEWHNRWKNFVDEKTVNPINRKA
jgi:hypothetical protein